MERKTASLADRVFERLESDILSGRYQKGELLTELRLVGDLGVSRTPIREALRRLEQERIVRLTQKGMEILGVGREEVSDMLDVRLFVEEHAASRAAERVDSGRLERLKETLELQEFYILRGDSARVCELDAAFHRLLCELSGSQVLCDLLIPLHKKLQRFRLASLEGRTRALSALEEHRAIYAAVSQKDPREAAAAMHAHVRNAKQSILKFL